MVRLLQSGTDTNMTKFPGVKVGYISFSTLPEQRAGTVQRLIRWCSILRITVTELLLKPKVELTE